MVKALLDIFYPPCCPVCGELSGGSPDGVHVDCKRKLPYISEPYCSRCGKPVETEEQEYCRDCEERGQEEIEGRAVFVYDDNMKSSIAAFKYGGRKEYRHFYGREIKLRLENWLLEKSPDVLIPVPVHRARERDRGYNQAALIAEVLGKEMRIPVNSNLLVRRKKTAPQKELGAKEREQNLKQAFWIEDTAKLLCRRIKCAILIDDIYTTGSTVRACAAVLKQAGVKEVGFISVCIGKSTV